MKYRTFVLAFVLAVCHTAPSVAFAQEIAAPPDRASDDEAAVIASLTPETRAAIVRALAEEEFGGAPKGWPIALFPSDIEESWLPTLPNVELEILSRDAKAAYDKSCRQYYWFGGFEYVDGSIFAAFLRGTECSYSGNPHRFVPVGSGWILKDQKGRGGGVGGGSSHCKCISDDREAALPYKDGAYDLGACPLEVTEIDRAGARGAMFSFLIDTDRNGAVASLKEGSSRFVSNSIDEGKIRDCVWNWKLEPDRQYSVVFSLRDPDSPCVVYVSNHTDEQPLRLLLRPDSAGKALPDAGPDEDPE